MGIDRSTLLQWIAAGPSDEAGATESMHETVRRVRGLWAHAGRENAWTMSDPSPVPIGDVAAYVDGGLDPDVQRALTDRAAVDDGLLIEMVSAVRAGQLAVPVSADLRSRLIAMGPTTSGPATVGAGPPNGDPPETPERETGLEPSPLTKRRSRRRQFRWAFAAVAIAGAVLLWLGRSWWLNQPLIDDQTLAPRIVETQPPPSDRPWVPDRAPDDQGPESGSAMAVARSPIPATDSDKATDLVPRMPEVGASRDGRPVVPSGNEGLVSDGSPNIDRVDAEMAPGNVAENSRDIASPMTVPPVNEPPENGPPVNGPTGTKPGGIVADPGGTDRQPDAPKLASSPPWAVRWQRVHGILLRRSIDDGSSTIPPAFAVQADSVTRAVTEVSDGASSEISEMDSGPPVGGPADVRFSLQTLPFCRAMGIAQDDAAVVIAGDSRLDIASDHSIDLIHGSIAWSGAQSDHVWWLARKDRGPIALQRVESAQLVVTGLRDHYEVSVFEGSIRLGSETLDPGVYRVSRQGNDWQTVQADEPNPPAWVRRPVDRIELPRTVLAQLGSTSDVSGTLRRQIAAMSVGTVADQRDRMMLCAWLAASNESRLYALVGSADAMVREAAMNRILQSPPTDPRHRVIWQGIAASQVRARVQQQVMSMFRLYWNRRRPEPAQSAQILRMLQMQDTQSRAIADYLLRAFYGDGPAFDPAMDNRTLARVVNAWDQIIRRSETRRGN